MEELENLLKNIKVNQHNKAKDHYSEMAWLPFQKEKLVLMKKCVISEEKLSA